MEQWNFAALRLCLPVRSEAKARANNLTTESIRE